MGIYRMCAGYELKGWRNVPYALVNAERRLVRKVSLSECLFLLGCDGKTELEDAPEAQKFLRRGIIEQLDVPAKVQLNTPTKIQADSPAPTAIRSDGQTDEQNSQSAEMQAKASTNKQDKACSQAQDDVPNYNYVDRFYRHVVQVAITGRCNLHCRHCLAADGDKNVSTQLTLEQCNYIFDEMVTNDIFRLWITGGEPLIHPDFRAIFKSAVDHGLRVDSIFTNAWLVDADLLDFIASTGERPEFVVSFDGIGTHDWMRDQEGAEEHTLEKIALLRERNYPVRIGLNVNSVTAPGVIKTCRTLVRDYHVTSLRPIYTSPTPRWDAALRDGVEPLLPGDYYDLMIDLVRASRVEKWDVLIDVVHMPKLHQAPKNPRLWGLLRTPPARSPERTIMSSCGRASNVLFIASDGRVMPCSTYEGETSVLGIFQGDDTNVLKTPLAAILSDSEYACEFKTTIADLEKMEPACVGCEWVSVCCGGCPLYKLARKYVDALDPICMLYKGGYATKYLDMLEETE